MTVADPPLATAAPEGGFVEEDGLEWFRITGYDLLDPFLVSVVTPTDQWMYVSSTGALTAGRRSADHALFPYETDDRLHRAGGRSGPMTLFRVGDADAWEPFAPHAPAGRVRRSIAKTIAGDRLRFEEHHPGLGLTFRYTWATADRFGFVRSCELLRDAGLASVDVEVLDGLMDVLPSGVDLADQQRASNLVDAYRRSELDETSGLALFTLEALVYDRPEPAESLRATVAWADGLPEPVVALSDRQVRRFRSGAGIDPEHLVTGRKGGFFVSAAATVRPNAPLRWALVADVERDHPAVARLRSWLARSPSPGAEVEEAVEAAHRDLVAVVAGADALQETADHRATAHHFANVLFNVMRGGVFLDDHRVDVADLARFVARRNRTAVDRFAAVAAGLGPVVEIGELRAAVAGDADLARLADEYLPLSFSRRHGDPSRPWNTFEIATGAGYEGNWRDIFQNWEALLHSYPEYIESVIAKFLNGSTVDGHNPYRLTDEGIDWEVPEEGNWANFGYWGDHQITYLHRLLDASRRFHPGLLEAALDRVGFSYADAPYRIRPYGDIVHDPKHTIEFDEDHYVGIERRAAAIGGDGLLVPAAGGAGIHHASLAEKLLVPALAKLSNFIAGGGIWMNTQRPEWNDANNALVGNGISVVTLFHLREYLGLLGDLLAGADLPTVTLGHRVAAWLEEIREAFDDHPADAEITPEARRSLLDALGRAYSAYRAEAYDHGPGVPTPVAVADLRSFVAAVQPHLDLVAATAGRPDGLADAYRLLELGPGTARVHGLPEMLEGQVAAIAASDMGAAKAVEIVDAMYQSELYRPDQRSFLLYPDRRPPPFVEKNVVPAGVLGPRALALLDAGSGILRRDEEGVIRFGSGFRSARELGAALDDLAAGTSPLAELAAAARTEVLDAYEAVFRHQAFTGRSGTMYRYEGLGSIYWHMVSKLLFALQERVVAAVEAGEDEAALRALAERYRRVRAGLGFTKSVAEQGTFPTDPHSHTPSGTGAQQPGMTGQVKEGVLLRWGELGVRVAGGRVGFRPVLLSPDEFLTEPAPWAPLGDGGALDAGTLGFTYCAVPVVYHLVDGDAWSRLRWADGREETGTPQLDRAASAALFARRGELARIDVGVDRATLLYVCG